MSEKYRNSNTTFNIPLNNSESDVYRIGCAHLQHFININVKTAACKPMMLKMHLELDDHPPPSSIGEAEGQRNIVVNNSNNGLRQSVQQLEEEMKVLKDALLQAMDDVLNRIDKAPDDDNSNKQGKNENKISREQHKDIDSVAKAASYRHHRNTMTKEKPKVIDLRDNCVYIENFQCSDSSLKQAFCNVRKLANEMNAEIPDDSIIHIDVETKYDNYFDYYVYFGDENIKKEFLKNRHFYVYHPQTSPLRIINYSMWGIVKIMNVESSDKSLETAYANVIGIAKKMEIIIYRDDIDHIDVFSTKTNFLNYSVRFTLEYLRKRFLQGRDILKQFPETKSLEILDDGGYSLSFRNVKNYSMTVASAYIIGLAELMALPSLCTDHFKCIYVLNYGPYHCVTRGLSLIVELSSKQYEFQEKQYKLYDMEHIKHKFPIISDINEKKIGVLMKYKYDHVATAISFIGLSKQLGFSLTPDQIQHFFDLSEFLHKETRTQSSEED